ncbi:hypothetical protein [Nocardia amamiensis]|uniref:hypothetical protein n=1 Tax=Nocardia amamiensis TaxID=404578 RepID=UPI0033C188A9
MTGHPGTELNFIHLTGSREQLHRRLTARMDHFMPPGLLDTQLDTLEEPCGEDDVVTIEIGPPPRTVAAAALAGLGVEVGIRLPEAADHGEVVEFTADDAGSCCRQNVFEAT